MENTEQILDSEIHIDVDKTNVELVDVNRFILLYIFSMGLYFLWWMYKSWRFFKEKDGEDIMPAVRAVFGIIFMYPLFERIQHFASESHYTRKFSSGLLTFAIIIIGLVGSKLPDPFWLVTYTVALLAIAPVSAMNFAIANSGRYNAIYGTLNARQIGILVVGSILWLIVLAGFFIPPDLGY
jgi:hypothetical protein